MWSRSLINSWDLFSTQIWNNLVCGCWSSFQTTYKYFYEFPVLEIIKMHSRKWNFFLIYKFTISYLCIIWTLFAYSSEALITSVLCLMKSELFIFQVTSIFFILAIIIVELMLHFAPAISEHLRLLCRILVKIMNQPHCILNRLMWCLSVVFHILALLYLTVIMLQLHQTSILVQSQLKLILSIPTLSNMLDHLLDQLI